MPANQDLRDAIQSLHAAIQSMPDPQDVDDATTCLSKMTAIQKRQMMADQQGGGQSGPPQGPAPPDAGGGGPAPPPGVDPQIAQQLMSTFQQGG